MSWLITAQDKYEGLESTPSSRMELEKQDNVLKVLLAEKTDAIALLNTTIEFGEKLYPTTAAEGRETIRVQLQELQLKFDTLFDNIGTSSRELQAKLTR